MTKHYYVVIRKTSGRYVVKDYKTKEEFERTKNDLRSIVINHGINRRDAKTISREFNDSHFPLKGLEKFEI